MNGATDLPWWALALRGATAIGFGVLAILWPGITLVVLVALFAAYALLGGAATIFGAVARGRKRDSEWWLPLAIGLVSIGAGAIAFLHPDLTALILVFLIGVHALLIGIFDIISAVRKPQASAAGWLVALSGVLSVLFAVLIFLFPGAGALAVIWLIGVYAILTGFLLLGAAFQMRAQARAGFTGRERRVNPDRRSHAH